MDEESQPSLVSIQRWRDSQETSSSRVLTGDGRVSIRAVKDTSHKSEALTDGQRDKSNRLGTAFFMSLGGGGMICSVLKCGKLGRASRFQILKFGHTLLKILIIMNIKILNNFKECESKYLTLESMNHCYHDVQVVCRAHQCC